MKSLRKLIALALTGVFLASGIVMASEAGRKNTRNALGAATVIMAVKGHKGAALVGAAGTIAAQVRLNQAIKARHKRQTASARLSHSYYAKGRTYHYYYSNGRRYDYYYSNGKRHTYYYDSHGLIHNAG